MNEEKTLISKIKKEDVLFILNYVVLIILVIVIIFFAIKIHGIYKSDPCQLCETFFNKSCIRIIP